MKLLSLYREQEQSCVNEPRYMLLADALAQGIASGVLMPGEALPTHRALAESLQVTVGTVSRGYAEAARRGLTQGITGRGTFVRAPSRDVDVPCESVGTEALRGHEPSADMLDLRFIAPFEHVTPPLAHALSALAQRADPADLAALAGYQQPRGLLQHREAGALWAARYGLPIAPDNVLVCAGAQHALLTVLASLFNPGDRLAVECLSYPLLRQLARRLRLTLVPIRMDEAGMLPDALEAICRTGPVHGVYMMPTCHNPTLAQIPLYRRHELVDVCRRNSMLIIEDDVYALSLVHNLPPISALAPERGCFIASTSEALSGGLRIAYLCAPESLYAELERTVGYTISMAPPLMAELARQWILDGTAEQVLISKRAEAAARNLLVRQRLDGFAVTTRTTGFFCWLRLPEPWTAARFAESARERNMLVAESGLFALGAADAEQGVRIALGGAYPIERLDAALQELALLLHTPHRAF